MEQRELRTDLIRAVSSATVVLLHSTSKIINNYQTVPRESLLAVLMVSGMTRWVVPVFLMVSGAIFLGGNYKYEGAVMFWKKRLSKVLIPIIFWNLLYFLVFMKDGNGNLQWAKGLREFYTVSGTYYHLYYMMVALGLYAVTPLLKKWLEWVGDKWFWWWIAWVAAANWYAVAYSWWNVPKIMSIPLVFIPYVGYYIMGAKIWKARANKKLLLGLMVSAGVAIALANFNIVYQYGVTMKGVFYHDRLTLLVLVQAVTVFVGLMGVTRFKNKLISEIASCSFGIYLVHPLITDGLLRGRTYRGGPVGTLLWLIGFWLVAWLVSFGIIQIIKRIPGVKVVVGN
ncbi:MAG: acyltransferase [Candidatus Shapirobacteria bacterium]